MHYIPGNHDLGRESNCLPRTCATKERHAEFTASIVHLSPGGSAYARERFTETFGPLNGHIDLGNHTLVWLDAPGLLDERTAAAEQFDTQGFDAINGGVVEFLRGFAQCEFNHVLHRVRYSHADTSYGNRFQAEKKLPRILLSHIPLYRQEGTNCGPLRESRSNLHQDRGSM